MLQALKTKVFDDMFTYRIGCGMFIFITEEEYEELKKYTGGEYIMQQNEQWCIYMRNVPDDVIAKYAKRVIDENKAVGGHTLESAEIAYKETEANFEYAKKLYNGISHLHELLKYSKPAIDRDIFTDRTYS